MLSRIYPLSIFALLLAGLMASCTPDQTPQEPANEATAPQSVVPPDPGQPADRIHAGSGGDTLADMLLEIEISGSSVTIIADNVSEEVILYSLAERTGFQVTTAGVPWKYVTRNINAVDLHTSLVELLKLYPYQIIYEFDQNIQADTLKRVVVGDPATGPAERTQSVATPDPAITTSTTQHKITPAVSYTASAVDEQLYLSLLMDPLPGVRQEAAEDIEPTGIALDYLARMVITDPSPEVRMAVASTLGDSEDPKALDALIMALQDEDPRVLEEVIDALGYVGNRATLPYLQPFLDHPDEDVRDAAEWSIDDLK